MSHYVYMLKCSDGTLYTGYATDVVKRVKEHNGEGDTPTQRALGARYTRSRRPVQLVHHERFDTRSEAMRREYAIKRLSRKEKERLFL